MWLQFSFMFLFFCYCCCCLFSIVKLVFSICMRLIVRWENAWLFLFAFVFILYISCSFYTLLLLKETCLSTIRELCDELDYIYIYLSIYLLVNTPSLFDNVIWMRFFFLWTPRRCLVLCIPNKTSEKKQRTAFFWKRKLSVIEIKLWSMVSNGWRGSNMSLLLLENDSILLIITSTSNKRYV